MVARGGRYNGGNATYISKEIAYERLFVFRADHDLKPPQRGQAPLWWFLQTWRPASLFCLNL